MDDRKLLRRSAIAAAMAAVLALGLAPDQAFGENCLDRVQQLASTYDVATDPPTVPPGGASKPVKPDDLGRSGGVIEPPETKDRAVITPPRDHSGMPTLPDIKPVEPKPQSGDKGRDKSATPKLGAADMSTLQALLVAARSQAERGMEPECLDALRKAEQLVERKH